MYDKNLLYVTFIKFNAAVQNILLSCKGLPLVGASVGKCSVLYRFYGLL